MIISLWITIGLVIAALSVSSLGAFFSITGLGALFSGALVAVWLMAGSLEFAKFVLAAYLHQTWKQLNVIYRSYLVFAVVVLSVITSIGVFGFLSQAYQSASTVLEAENIKMETIVAQKKMNTAEIERLNRSIDEIPVNRVTKRLKARAEVEPAILALNTKIQEGEKALSEANLTILEVKKKVGPLIYIAKSFNMDIDLVVKYLILIFVSVFDPLAICLVIATTHAVESRRHHRFSLAEEETEEIPEQVKPVEKAEVPQEPPVPVSEPAAEEDIVVQMNFKDESEDKKAV
jgi:hypothetical protein